MSDFRALTSEEYEAISNYAKRRTSKKTNWKNQLLTDWQSGKTQGTLQALRNALGPKWLKGFELDAN